METLRFKNDGRMRDGSNIQMPTGKQHVEINRKMWLRRQLCSKANPEGAVYVPYIGDGDLATIFYPGRHVYGADLDPKRVETAQARLPGADIRVHDVEVWPFSDVTVPFSLADFDAYGNPYRSFKAFWESAEKCFPLVVIFTDGLRLRVQRGDMVWNFETQKAEPSLHPNNARRQYNFWLKQHALPWVQRIINPYAIIGVKFGLRRQMVYWGGVIIV